MDHDPGPQEAESAAATTAAIDYAKTSVSRPLWTFLKGVLRLGFAIGVALLLVLSCVTAAMLIYHAQEDARNQRKVEPLRKVKQWPAVTLLTASRAHLDTKWGDGGALLRLSITDLPPGGLLFDDGARLIVRFVDADGFNVLERSIPANELSRSFGGDLATVGFEWQGEVATTSETYARIRGWTMLWAGVRAAQNPQTSTELKTPAAPSPPPAWTIRENWRKVRSGMSESAVRRVLGEPTYVEVSVYKYWVYGGTNWATNAHVSFLNGVVEGWQEP
jgi:hypothetical protein